MRHLSLGLVAAVFAVAAEPAIAQPATWTGFYVGANIGGSWGNSSSSFAVTDATTGVGRNLSASDFDMHGVIGGGQFGYNWQSSNWVLGLEADIQASSQKGVGRSICAAGSLATGAGTLFSSSCLPGHVGDTADFNTPAGSATSTLSQSLDWFGTVRGRVGYIAAPGLLAYLTGGLAYGRIESALAVNGTNITGGQGTNTLILTPVSATLNTSHINTGWTIGAGTEIIFVEGHSRDTSDRIEEALTSIPAVVSCYLVSGSADFMVEAAVPDLAAYEQLLLSQILTIPSVTEAHSTFAIRTILSRGPIPLDHWR